MTSMNQQENQYKPSHAPLASNEAPKYSWANASVAMTRFQELKRAALAEACSLTKEQAEDYAQVAAWLDMTARQGTLRVRRRTTDGGRIACHDVLLLEEEDGEVNSIEFGGYVSMSELKRGAHGGTAWLYNKEEIVEGYFRIEVMITDQFPDHPMFKRSDGSFVDLGFNDNEHFYSFMVDIPKENLSDAF